MRIIGKECKKILNIRLLLILCIFSALYYNIFMEITRYPSGGQTTASPYDIPFAAELVREIGPTLEVKDWSRIDDKIDKLKEEFGKELLDYPALRETGITTYDKLKKLEDDLIDKAEDEMSKKEKILYDEMSDAIFFSQKSSKIYFEIQYAKNMNEFEGMKYGASQDDINQFCEAWREGITAFYEHTIRKRWTKQEVSLLPEGVFYILQADMRHMAVLLVICFFVLMVPYQVKERLRGVTPLYVSTHTGREIFGTQFMAGMVSCAAVGMLQFLVYLGIWISKGLLIFWKCPAWTCVENTCLIDFLPFGAYMLLYLLLVWIFALAGTVPAYWIGRTAVNYIVGIALSIPFAGVIGYVGKYLFAQLFQIEETTQRGFWELIVLIIWLCIAGILIWLRLKRDKRRDIFL